MCEALSTFVTMGWVSDFCENTKWDQSEFSDLSLTGETPCFEDIVLGVLVSVRLPLLPPHVELRFTCLACTVPASTAGSVQIAFLVLVPVRLYQVCGGRGAMPLCCAHLYAETAQAHHQAGRAPRGCLPAMG